MSTPELVEDAFFTALLEGDADRLGDVLTEEFVIVDVMSGSITDRQSFLRAVHERVVNFGGIEVAERSTRRYDGAAVIVGRTAMRGAIENTTFSLASRYTHVFVGDSAGGWRLASAQGTPIAATG